MTIPEVRRELLKVARKLAKLGKVSIARKLRSLEGEMYRRAYDRTPVRSQKITRVLQATIRRYKRQHPDASRQMMGDVFRVNQARITEAIRGKRK
jgi:hypothetical protein